MKLFEARLLVEGLRVTEANSLTLPQGIKVNGDKTFESLLIERAQNHQQRLNIETLFAHFKKISANIFWLLSIFTFFLGAFAVRNVLFAEPSNSVNFFWAFALFFIPNIAMLIVWLLFFIRPAVIQNSGLARFF
ncbi:hypothetical protein ACLKMH_04160 [Psychromonas sp. KJ10-10]|uniref:hypothetical protein n=1 Tax=Psychromonas sp. KJ10-10 TaxID=3391823 RepID=UPI0039B5B2F3